MKATLMPLKGKYYGTRIEISDDAEKKAQERIIQAQGEAQAILDVANAQAKANKVVAASLTPVLIQQNWIEQWDGRLPKTSLGDSANISLLMDNREAK